MVSFYERLKHWIKKRRIRTRNYIFGNISPIYLDKYLYKRKLQRHVNLEQPSRFTDKLMWLKLFDRSDIKSTCTDKFAVREYVASKGLEEILVESYGVYHKADEINFANLPDKFALKCTHGCGYNIISSNRDTFNEEDAKRKLNKWMKENFGYNTAEWHYSNIEPKIICERYIEDESGEFPIDYKIHCLNGDPKIIQVIKDRHNQKEYFLMNTKWEKVNLKKWNGIECNISSLEKPEKLDEMLAIAKTLSTDFKYVRVDLYLEKNRILFGELTFTPATCKISFEPDSYDFHLGSQLSIE